MLRILRSWCMFSTTFGHCWEIFIRPNRSESWRFITGNIEIPSEGEMVNFSSQTERYCIVEGIGENFDLLYSKLLEKIDPFPDILCFFLDVLQLCFWMLKLNKGLCATTSCISIQHANSRVLPSYSFSFVEIMRLSTWICCLFFRLIECSYSQYF